MAFELSAVIRLQDKFTRNMNRVKSSADSFTRTAQRLDRVSSSFDSVGRRLTRSITLPATAAASALAGITMVKGFNRLVGIDTAQAKLKALGHDAQNVERIMESALDSVTGTAYGLDIAATTAASAVAAGIRPGEDLTRYLSLTADAAAIAGAEMGEMGSIFNKVQTAQRAYNGELRQLADRGLPIYQWLAESAGVTEDAVRDMAANGQVSSRLFLDAIEKNIGGASKTMGEESFSAAIANIGADISRIGASFLGAGGKTGGFFETVKPMLTEFRGVLSTVEEKALVWGEKFGDAFNKVVDGARRAKAWFDDLSPSMQSVIMKTAGIGAAFAVGIGPALKLTGALISGVSGLFRSVSMLTSPVGLIVVGLAALAAGAVLVVSNWDKIKSKAAELYDSMTWLQVATDLIVKGWKALGRVADFVIGEVVALWNDWGGTIKQIFTDVGAIVETIWGAVMTFIKLVSDDLIAFWGRWGGVITSVFTGIFGGIKNYALGIWNGIKIIIDTALNVIKNVVKTVLSIVTGDWAGAWEGIKGIAVSVWDGIIDFLSNIVGTMINIGKDIIGGIWDGMKGTWDNLKNWVSDKVSWMADKLAFWRKGNKEMSDGSSGDGSSVDGSHFGGLWRVPFDGYIARLHKGERVLTAGQADAYDRLTYDQSSHKSTTVNKSYSTVRNVSHSGKDSGGPAGVTVSGNTFIVRKDSDIKEIANELFGQIKSSWEAGA